MNFQILRVSAIPIVVQFKPKHFSILVAASPNASGLGKREQSKYLSFNFVWRVKMIENFGST
jgi:hypothetical protein